MSEYLLMVLEDEGAHAAEAPRSVANLIEDRARYTAELRRAGALRDCGRLRASKEGRRVRRIGDEVQVKEGPFEEEGRAFGGYYWVEASDLDSAAQMAAKCPVLASDIVEVRPIMKGNVDADKEGKPGKIFAFGVLGNAETEDAWIAVMDRIDEASRDGVRLDGRVGGVRLDPPKKGRRVATEGARRAIFDGPFLESKEVIGGLFFVRMTSIDEAVRWAGGTPFIALGALEIRELWRT